MKCAHQPNNVPNTSGVWKWFLCMLWESFSLIWSCPKTLYLFWFFRGTLVASKVLWGYFPTAFTSSLWLVWSKVRGRRVALFLFKITLKYFSHCRLIFRGTLSYGLNQLLNQESDINKKRKNTGSRRKGCLVGKLSHSKKQTHQWCRSLEAFLQMYHWITADTMLWSKTSAGLWKPFWSFI